ncbi:4'-phosphopantetheinyl transferase [Streptomyces sp. NPDC059913]|uniref:4'-phosphopantetheinyl transferase family protein n=1 Tax=unclassified Streptomyces TaxID=2593676 RepID=UPI00364E44C3
MTGRRRPGGIVHGLVSGAVAAVDSWGEFDGGAVFPQEERVIARAVPKRRREFTGARHCARRALAELSVPPVPILPGTHGAPVWPTGTTGSITHTEDYRAAAVARTTDVRAIGIDAEPHQRMPGRTAEFVTANAYEAAVLRRLAGEYPGVHWDRLVFSAKEATYKIWSTFTGHWLGFEDAVVVPDPSRGTFEARLLVPGPVVDGVSLRRLHGRWAVREGLVVTAIVLAAAPA